MRDKKGSTICGEIENENGCQKEDKEYLRDSHLVKMK